MTKLYPRKTSRRKGWRVVTWGAGADVLLTEVVPVADLSPHARGEKARACWCNPSVEMVEGIPLVGHKAADGRELVEAHGVN